VIGPKLSTMSDFISRWMSDLQTVLTRSIDEQKQQRPSKTSRGATGKGADTTLGEKEQEWVSSLVVDVVTVAARHSAQRFAEVEEKFQAVSARADGVDERIRALEEKASRVDDLIRQLGEQGQQLEVLKRAQPATPTPCASASSASGSSHVSGTPMDQRTAALLGNVGWDLQDLQLVLRATKALTDAQVDSQHWQGMEATCRPGGTGSAVTLHFRDNRSLLVAKAKIRSLGLTLPGAKGQLFLDIQKTWEERKPARELRALQELVVEALAPEIAADRVSIDHRTRSLSINGARSAFIGKGVAYWTPVGEAMLKDAQRMYIKAVVDAAL